MSLYVGKDSTGTGVLHLTQGDTDLVSMKSGILPNTVFHSLLRYTTWVEYPLTPVTRESGNVFLRLDRSVAADIGANRRLFLVSIGGTIIQYISQVYEFDSVYGYRNGGWFGRWYGGGHQFYDESGIPDGGHYDYLPPAGIDLSNSKLYVLNLTDSGYININTPANDIQISNSNITVRGVNLLNLKYVSPVKINNVDTTLNLGGHLIQLINSYTFNPSRLSLISNRSESSIKRNGEAIFTSLAKCNINYLGSRGRITTISSSYTITLPWECVGSICYIVVEVGYWYGGVSPHNVFSPLLIIVGSGQSMLVAQLKHISNRVIGSFYISSTSGSNVITITRSGSTNFKLASVAYHYFK